MLASRGCVIGLVRTENNCLHAALLENSKSRAATSQASGNTDCDCWFQSQDCINWVGLIPFECPLDRPTVGVVLRRNLLPQGTIQPSCSKLFCQGFATS